jgi:hypothetical protein
MRKVLVVLQETRTECPYFLLFSICCNKTDLSVREDRSNVKSKDEIIDKAFISVNFTPLSGAGGYAFIIHYQTQKTDFTREY